MEVTKLIYDRYIQRKQLNSLQSKTMTMATTETTTTTTDDFQKEIVEELRKLNLALKQIQMAVDDIPAKIERTIKSFHDEQQQQQKNSNMNDDDDYDHETTVISDDIEILDYIRNTDMMVATQLLNNNDDDNNTNCDQPIYLSSSSSTLENYYENDFYRHWSRNFHRQTKSSSLSASSSLSNGMFKLSLNDYNNGRTWLYHLDHPCPKANQSIMPYSRELDLDFWLIN